MCETEMNQVNKSEGQSYEVMSHRYFLCMYVLYILSTHNLKSRSSSIIHEVILYDSSVHVLSIKTNFYHALL